MYFRYLSSATSILLVVTTTALSPVSANGLLNLPLGHVKPVGWLYTRLKGGHDMFGRAEGFYNYLSHAETTWITRPTDHYTIETAGSHWFNDMVSVAAIFEIDTLQSQTEQFLDYYLDTQGPDGWLGPETNTTGPRRLSPRYPFLLGAIRMAEAQPECATRIASALHRFVGYVYGALKQEGDMEYDAWAYTGDLLRVIAWLSERHPNGQQDVLAEVARMLEERTCDTLSHVFREENFPSTFNGNTQWPLRTPDPGFEWRSMNTIKALATMAARYRLSGTPSDREAIDEAWSMLLQHQGHPSGTYMPDPAQRFWGDWRRVHSITELMRSVSYMYQVAGDPQYADRAERIFYNVLWAAGNKNPWTTLWSASLCRGSYPEDGPYRGVFKGELYSRDECSVHTYPEGWMDFIYDAFQTTAVRASLVHVYPGPFAVNTTLAGKNKVIITVNTSFPFNEDTLRTTIIADHAFTYYVRIPEWSHNATISVNGGAALPCAPTNGLHAIPVKAGATNLTLTLPAHITTDARPAGRVIVRRGPLLFTYDDLAHACPDWQYTNLNDNVHYAIDPATLRSSDARARWVFGMPAMRRTLAVAACPVEGHNWWDGEAPMYERGRAVCVGAVRNLTLTAYAGSAFYDQVDLEFPTFALSNTSTSFSG